MNFKHFLICMLVAVMFGVVWSQNSDIAGALNSLPPELQGKVNESEIEAIKNKTENLFREKCEKNGSPEAFLSAKKAYEEFPDCVKKSLGLADPSMLQKEIDDARPNGTVDEVFKKYCAKTPEAKQCFKDMTEAVKPCFSLEEQKNLKTIYNISEQLAEFICYKDGDRIALFIAEGGPECFEERKEAIQDCVNATLGSDYQFNPENITSNAIPQISFGAKECKQLSELQLCVVAALEKCKAPTSANIVESLFKFARQATPCGAGKKESSPRSQVGEADKPNSANTIYTTTIAIVLTAFALLY